MQIKTQEIVMAKTANIIVALDFAERDDALCFLDQINPTLCRVKIGKEMFTRFGPQFVETVIKRGFDVFLDLKFHDIPNTVAKACQAAADLGVWMLNVHALGGPAMLEAAHNALANYQVKLIAVTILTSLTDSDLATLGIQGTVADNVLRWARLTQNAGLDGAVCSAQEASVLRNALGTDFLLVTPGIRLSTSLTDDQKRIMTPSAAFAAGADYLVIGRPITQAPDPLAVLKNII